MEGFPGQFPWGFGHEPSYHERPLVQAPPVHPLVPGVLCHVLPSAILAGNLLYVRERRVGTNVPGIERGNRDGQISAMKTT